MALEICEHDMVVDGPGGSSGPGDLDPKCTDIVTVIVTDAMVQRSSKYSLPIHLAVGDTGIEDHIVISHVYCLIF